jgi:hypothetical protein
MNPINRSLGLSSIAFRVLRFFVVLSFGYLARSQETASNSSLFLPPSQVQAPEISRAHCKLAINCFDAGLYIVTVIDIIEGDIPGYRKARLVLRFDNLSDATLVLAYRSGSSFMVDNFRNRYSCCQTDGSKEDTSAIGIGIDHDDKLSPQFRLKSRASDTVSFDLWRHRPPDQPASYYHFDVMIDELDQSGQTILRHPVLFFRNLLARAPETDQKR